MPIIVTSPPGATTTVTHLDYSSSSGFTLNSSLITFENAAAQLKNQFNSAVTFAANYTSNVNGIYSRDSGLTTASTAGTIVITSGKADLTTVDEYKKIAYEAWKNFPPKNTGCVRMRVTPNWSGTPGTVQTFISAYSFVNSAFNYIWFYQWTDGKIYMNIEDNSSSNLAQGGTADVWNPTSGTTYEIELNWDTTNGVYTAYVDSARLLNLSTATGNLRPIYDYFQIGSGYTNDSAHHANFKVDDFIVYDTVQNTGATRTTGYTLPTAKYVTTDPTIEQTTGVVASRLTYFCSSDTAAGSDGVKYHIKVNDQAKYHNGSAWVNSNGSYAQSNTDTEIHDNRTTLPSGTYKVVAVLHSNDGSTTPYLSSIAMATE